MVIDLQVAGQLILIATFVFGCFRYIVITPLKNAIGALGKGVEALNKNIVKLRGELVILDKEIGIIKEQIKVINHRIGDLEEYTKK